MISLLKMLAILIILILIRLKRKEYLLKLKEHSRNNPIVNLMEKNKNLFEKMNTICKNFAGPLEFKISKKQ